MLPQTLSSVVVACLSAVALVSCAREAPPVSAPPAAAYDDATVRLLNEAAGLMGKFEFERAAAKYAEAFALPAKPPEAALGRAIATLNQSRDGAQDEALAMLGEFVASKPSKDLELRARYCMGLCLLYLGKPAEAAAAFVPVAEARSTDADALYFAAQALEQTGQIEKALDFYQRSAARDPYLKSAELGIQRCARRLGDDERAERALAAFEKLAANPRGRSAEFKYTRMGALGLAVVPDARAPYTPPQGPIFAESAELSVRWPEGSPARWSSDGEQHAVVADIDRDGRLDLVVARGLEAEGGARTLVLLGEEDGGFRAEPAHPLAELAGVGVQSILVGDIDSDGRVDMYACRTGGNRLLLAADHGGFIDATEAWGARGRGDLCVDGALADLDHDGDLDLFLVYRDAPNQLLSNNLDGTFRSIGADAGVASEGLGPMSVIVGDFDHDRDTDIFVLNETLPHELFINDRLWKYTKGSVPGLSDAQATDGAVAAAVVDIADIPLRRFVLANSRYLRLPTRMETLAPAAGVRLAVADATGDGRQNLFVLASDRVELRDEGAGLLETLPVPEGTMRTQLVSLEPLRGPSLLFLRAGKAPLVRHGGTGRGPFAAISLSGRTDPSQSMRSNTSGIGASFAARIGGAWFGGETFRAATGRGQSLAPVSIGTAPFGRIDYLEIEWSDGVFQTEVDLEAGALHEIVETQRQISSCPVLFAWNGAEMRFVSDLLGVGGMGYLLAPGQYAESRPWEYFVLPEGALAPRADGTLSLTLAEPMEESCMLDSIRMRAVDLPEGWDIAPDERLSVGGPAPTGEIVAWRTAREQLPKGVAELAKPDLVAVDPGARDPRFLGRLAGEHVVELEFGVAVDAMRDPWLVIDGWVEYPYSQTMFAAWQAGADYRPPNLEARGADGAWVEVLPSWGYMAGMPRRMALPVPRAALPAGTTALRMRMNVELYLDSVRLVEREALPVEPVELPMARASLASVGFAAWSTGPQKQPFYDRANLLPLWDCRVQRGLYTEFGDVRELLARDDGALVVFGPGEEVAFDFAGPAAAPAAGSTRRFVLETRGWCKDMDLFTRNGETVDPLPVDPIDEDARELMKRTRTRPAGGR
ncbi:MAG: hypothetical protein GC172_13145 [Phycisphaera sp.]|nr:hypothetical protein [Phycisphaera sp.]